MIDLNEAQTYRTLGFVLGFAALLLWERRAPRERVTAPWRTRWTANLSLLLMNSLATTAICLICFWVRTSLVDAPWWRPFAHAPALRLLVEIILLDAAMYWQHRLMHEVPWLWRWHAVHHSDLHLDVTSASRFHLGEILLSGVYKLIVVLTLGISLTGLVVFEAVVLLAAQFQHANIRLQPTLERWLQRVVMTPRVHYLHHSQITERRNTNYGTLLTLWDHAWRTWCARFEKDERIGVPQYLQAEKLNLLTLLSMPFRHS
jgi:sterol desaturase/sphingolipid hydroxylase (fatty acid hydroxylase superfamily)